MYRNDSQCLKKMKYFQKQPTEGTSLKILVSKQMLQRLPITLAQVNISRLKHQQMHLKTYKMKIKLFFEKSNYYLYSEK